MITVIFVLFTSVPLVSTEPLPSLDLLSGPNGYLIKEYINAITAYGPGLGVYSPYTYVDISYDNIPFVGKIPVLGKEGTSSKLGISPWYPPNGNPSNPWPPLYRARPLPLHVPEPQEVVAVPLDEEALHGEPLFPAELALPSETADGMHIVHAVEDTSKGDESLIPQDPFGNDNTIPEGFVEWSEESAISNSTQERNGFERNRITDASTEKFTKIDKANEKNVKMSEVAQMKIGENDKPKSPFRNRRILMQ